MSYMLYGCSSLKELNLNNFNTINVTNMSWMFSGLLQPDEPRPEPLRHFKSDEYGVYVQWLLQPDHHLL